jgi:hypothetical protein
MNFCHRFSKKKSSNIKFHGNQFSGSRVVPSARTDMPQLMVTFRNFANARKLLLGTRKLNSGNGNVREWSEPAEVPDERRGPKLRTECWSNCIAVKWCQVNVEHEWQVGKRSILNPVALCPSQTSWDGTQSPQWEARDIAELFSPPSKPSH